MIPASSFSGRQVAVFGLGGSGRATVASLAAGGAVVAAWDDNAATRDSAAAAGIPLVDLHAADWSGFAALVLAPGVPLTHPDPHWTARRAERAGVEIIGDIEIFCRERRRNVPDAPFVAITGTNGKSTTTALIAHLLSGAGRDVQLGGNIGTPVLSLEPPRMGRYHVVEVPRSRSTSRRRSTRRSASSSTSRPTISTATAPWPAMRALKERLVAGARAAVIAVDDDFCQAVADRIEQRGGRVVRVSARRPLAERRLRRRRRAQHRRRSARCGRSPSLGGIRLAPRRAQCPERGGGRRRGGAARPFAKRRSSPALRTFRGLPHRMEQVGRRGRVLFVNDSKATNADAAGKALKSFDRIYWIAGGRPKEGGIDEPRRLFPEDRQGLPDRRGDGGFRGDASARGCRSSARGRWRRRSPRRQPMPTRDRGGGAGGAAVAGLRLLRPVPEFRAAGRCLPRARPLPRRHLSREEAA